MKRKTTGIYSVYAKFQGASRCNPSRCRTSHFRDKKTAGHTDVTGRQLILGHVKSTLVVEQEFLGVHQRPNDVLVSDLLLFFVLCNMRQGDFQLIILGSP
ncbi:hypothetical protein Pan258_26090 [Symmachiella dynata]|nr:hypothetical protein Pan258_26090 [Symmachiella dynata]